MDDSMVMSLVCQLCGAHYELDVYALGLIDPARPLSCCNDCLDTPKAQALRAIAVELLERGAA